MSRTPHSGKTRSKAQALWISGLSPTQIAGKMGIPVRTVETWATKWRHTGAVQASTHSAAPVVVESDALKAEVRTLKSLLKAQHKDTLSTEKIRGEIFKLAEQPLAPPDWLIDAKKLSKHSPGVPTLFCSDWHWGEVVDPTQIPAEINSYNVGIAHTRARLLIERTIDLLNNHMVNPDYPGIVMALGGDMVSGDIHEELLRTNELDIMPTVIDLIGVLRRCITALADHFGRVFLPCVTGNHGRNTHKIRSKGRNTTNFDWLIYTFLEKTFEDDDRVRSRTATSFAAVTA